MTPVYKVSQAGSLATARTNYRSMLAGNATFIDWQPESGYDALATVTVPTGGLATFEFAGIPSSYKHLEIRYIAKNTVTGDQIFLRFNGDTGANYARHEVSGFGSGTGAAYSGTSQASMLIGFESFGASASFGSGIIHIADAASTSKTKTVRSLTGYDLNGSGGVGFLSGLWFKTPEAITSITFIQGNGGNFAAGSQFSLYGVK